MYLSRVTPFERGTRARHRGADRCIWCPSKEIIPQEMAVSRGFMGSGQEQTATLTAKRKGERTADVRANSRSSHRNEQEQLQGANMNLALSLSTSDSAPAPALRHSANAKNAHRTQRTGIPHTEHRNPAPAPPHNSPQHSQLGGRSPQAGGTARRRGARESRSLRRGVRRKCNGMRKKRESQR